MVGLGTFFVAITAACALLLARGRLFASRPALWALLLSCPFPFIANTAGWMTAELGRQPWVVYGLQRTAVGFSDRVSAGNAAFTLIGFMGLYTVLSPKDIFSSIKRALLPTSPITVATETTITDITPGDDRLPSRTQLVVA